MNMLALIYEERTELTTAAQKAEPHPALAKFLHDRGGKAKRSDRDYASGLSSEEIASLI